MNEKQAWTFCAKKFNGKLKRDTLKEHYFLIDDQRMYGVCGVLYFLKDSASLHPVILAAMLAKINKVAKHERINGGFKWIAPLTKAGAKKRAAFCRRMARACK